MDIQSLSSYATQGTGGIQGIQQHHHRKSLADMVTDIESAIDNAVGSGKLSGDLGAQIKKQLEAIADELKQTQASSGQTGTTDQMSSDDRMKIRKELREIGKELFAALNSQDSSQSTAVRSSNDLFSKIDTDSNGSISKGELSGYLSQMYSSGANNADTANSNATYGQQGSFKMTVSMTMKQSTFSMYA
jgi:hypothetical protein